MCFKCRSELNTCGKRKKIKRRSKELQDFKNQKQTNVFFLLLWHMCTTCKIFLLLLLHWTNFASSSPKRQSLNLSHTLDGSYRWIPLYPNVLKWKMAFIQEFSKPHLNPCCVILHAEFKICSKKGFLLSFVYSDPAVCAKLHWHPNVVKKKHFFDNLGFLLAKTSSRKTQNSPVGSWTDNVGPVAWGRRHWVPVNPSKQNEANFKLSVQFNTREIQAWFSDYFELTLILIHLIKLGLTRTHL